MTVDQALIDQVLTGGDPSRELTEYEQCVIARAARKRGWTARTIAATFGVPERRVRQWLAGRTPNPRAGAQ